jgi:hypothetical protein
LAVTVQPTITHCALTLAIPAAFPNPLVPLPEMVEPLMVSVPPETLRIPPPNEPAVFPEIVQLVIAIVLSFSIPPPFPAELPDYVLSMTTA